MSDRIDELVTTIGCEFGGWGMREQAEAALTELATIAREAEARAKRFEDKYEWDETTIAALHDSEETLVADWRIADAMPKQQQWEVGPVTCVQHDWRLVASGTAGNRYTCVNCGATRTEV